MDATLKIVRETRAQESIIDALARSPAEDEDIEELRSIRLDGRFRDAFDLYEREKILEILDRLFPVAQGFSQGKGEAAFIKAGEDLGDLQFLLKTQDEEILRLQAEIARLRPAPRFTAPPPLDQSTVDLLREQGGLETIEAVREASDEELLAIAGVGPKRLAEIREKVG